MSFCPKCGKEIPDDNVFCPYCGAKTQVQAEEGQVPVQPPIQTASPMQEPPKNKSKLPIIIGACVAGVLVIGGVVAFAILNKEPSITQDITSVEAGSGIEYSNVLSSTDENVVIAKLAGDVDTNTPGSYTVRYSYGFSNRNKRFEKDFEIEVVDTTPPTFEQKTTEFEFEEEVDLLDKSLFTAKDSVDNAPNVRVKAGVIDTSTPGDYEVTYVVTDASGNETEGTATYHVNQKKYSIDELGDLLEEHAKDLVSQGYDITCERDKYDNSVYWTGIPIPATKLSGNISYGAVIVVSTQPDDPDHPFSIFLTLPITSKDIFSQLSHFYFQGGGTVVDLTDVNEAGAGDWDLGKNFYFNSNAYALPFGWDVSHERLDDLEKIFSSDDASFKITGSFTIEDEFPEDGRKMLLEAVREMQDLLSKYEGTY